MNGTDYIAKILKSEGVETMTCYPSNPLIESAASRFQTRTWGYHGSRRYQQNRWRSDNRGCCNSITGRCRERNGWYSPGLCRQYSNIGSTRRIITQPVCSQTQFLSYSKLPGHRQASRGNLQTRRRWRRDASRISCPAQRATRSCSR